MTATPLRAVRVDDELWAAAQARAHNSGVTLSEVIRDLLSDWISAPQLADRTTAV